MKTTLKMAASAIILTAACVSGCASMDYHSGTKVDQASFDKLQRNKTTASEVKTQFGEPQKVRSEEGNTIYVYTHDKIASNPFSKNESETVVLTFKNGVLINKDRRESNNLSSNPLTGN